MLHCSGLVYSLVGAWLEAAFVWVVWSSICVVVGVPYSMMLAFPVLSGSRIFGRELGVLICVYGVGVLFSVPLDYLRCGVAVFCIGVHVIGFVLFSTFSLLVLYSLYLG